MVKETYTAGLGEGAVPGPLMMPLMGGELVGLIWVRPLHVGQDALAGIAELANIAAAAGADEVVLAWETVPRTRRNISEMCTVSLGRA
ncbi:hypothetical protein [Streptomyces virginiae]|uniref:hypothetical protein n=1 Tax=Streptomyces virginiae TaxID=1961 RepID=UPI003659BEFD